MIITTIKKYLLGITLCSLMAMSCQKENVIQQVEDVCTMMDDISFMRYCYDHFDVNNDGKVSMEEANAVSIINLSALNGSIKSLKGLQYFPRLTELNCIGNKLTVLDVTKNTQLKVLYCTLNKLTALDVTKNTQLSELSCSRNQLTTLDVTKNTQLSELSCSRNQLTTLDVTKNTQLTELHCDNNQLTALDVTKNTQLKVLYCAYNQLTALDVTMNTQLGRFIFNPQSAGDITPMGWSK